MPLGDPKYSSRIFPPVSTAARDAPSVNTLLLAPPLLQLGYPSPPPGHSLVHCSAIALRPDTAATRATVHIRALLAVAALPDIDCTLALRALHLSPPAPRFVLPRTVTSPLAFSVSNPMATAPTRRVFFS